jgi:DNA-binding MarR family transcriptional regulator
MSTQARIDEARALSGKLFQVVRRIEHDFESIAAEFGLTSLQARTLLGLQEPMAMRDLSEEMACDASNVTGLADRLERLGLVERVPGSDRRVKLLTLTAKGCTIRTDLESRLASSSAVTSLLKPTERAQLDALLDKLLEA